MNEEFGKIPKNAEERVMWGLRQIADSDREKNEDSIPYLSNVPKDTLCEVLYKFMGNQFPSALSVKDDAVDLQGKGKRLPDMVSISIAAGTGLKKTILEITDSPVWRVLAGVYASPDDILAVGGELEKTGVLPKGTTVRTLVREYLNRNKKLEAESNEILAKYSKEKRELFIELLRLKAVERAKKEDEESLTEEEIFDLHTLSTNRFLVIDIRGEFDTVDAADLTPITDEEGKEIVLKLIESELRKNK